MISLDYPNSYFDKYMKMSVSEMSNSYCVKSSLSVEDILSTFNIPVNKIHFTNNEGSAIHQSFEYWNPYFKNWIIIDPFYGVCFVNKKGILLGFDELKKYADKSKIDSTFLRHVEIQPFYFNLEEISIGWNSQMFRGANSFNKMSIAF